MAFARDAQTQYNSNASGSPYTTWSFSHTCTGTRLILFAFIQTGTQPTSVKYNGVTMTLLTSQNVNGGVFVYYLLAPATGANTVLVTWPTSQSSFAAMTMASYKSANQIAPTIFATSSVSSTSNPSASITTAPDYMWILGIYASGGAVFSGGFSFTAGLSLVSEDNSYAFGDSNGAITPPAAVTCTGHFSGALNYDIILVAVSPLTGTPSLSMLNSASRLISLGSNGNYSKAISLAIMNAASRFATTRKDMSHSVSTYFMNAASRFITLANQAPSWSLIAKNLTSWTDQPK